MSDHEINDIYDPEDDELSLEDSFTFIHGDNEGLHHAIASDFKITVIPEPSEHVRVYRRVTNKISIGADANKGLSVTSDVKNRTSYIVAELGDVRVYFQKGRIIVTKQKLV